MTLTSVDAGGMAHHKVADRHWTPLPTVPAEDREERLLYPPSTAATLNLAATAAQCARIWRAIDKAFAHRCLVAAGKAYRAALRNPDIYAAQDFEGSGGYGDTHLDDERYWATAELYATTRCPNWPRRCTACRCMAHRCGAKRAGPMSGRGDDHAGDRRWHPVAERDAARAKLVALADAFLAERERSGYHLPYATTDYVWGSNGAILSRGIVLALAARFTGETRYRDAVVDTADYVLGRNPLDQRAMSPASGGSRCGIRTIAFGRISSTRDCRGRRRVC